MIRNMKKYEIKYQSILKLRKKKRYQVKANEINVLKCSP